MDSHKVESGTHGKDRVQMFRVGRTAPYPSKEFGGKVRQMMRVRRSGLAHVPRKLSNIRWVIDGSQGDAQQIGMPTIILGDALACERGNSKSSASRHFEQALSGHAQDCIAYGRNTGPGVLGDLAEDKTGARAQFSRHDLPLQFAIDAIGRDGIGRHGGQAFLSMPSSLTKDERTKGLKR